MIMVMMRLFEKKKSELPASVEPVIVLTEAECFITNQLESLESAAIEQGLDVTDSPHILLGLVCPYGRHVLISVKGYLVT